MAITHPLPTTAAVSLNNEGVALAAEGRIPEAIARFRDALVQNPEFAEAHVNLGIALERTGHFADAEHCYERALAIEPLHSAAHLNWGITLEKQGRTAEAVRRYRTLFDLRPDLPEAPLRLGCALSALSAWSEALPVLRLAVRSDPKSFTALYHWAIALQKNRHFVQAEQACRRALWLEDAASRGKTDASRSMRANLLNELANTLLALGRADEAIDCFRQAVPADTANAAIHSNLIYAMHYSAATTQEQIHAESVEWGRRHACAGGDRVPGVDDVESSAPALDPCRRLRIGYVAPDLRQHPAGFFFEPVLEHHDRSRFEVFVYADLGGEDDASRRFSSKAEHWRPIGGMADERVAGMIRLDAIDLLIDLHGHAGWHRLGVFARKPARLQAAWMSYPSTTGLPQIGWRITDDVADPPGSEACNSERLLRLPRAYLAYEPSAYSPPVNDLPALSQGRLTFGCLNNPCKITGEVIETWAAILAGVPGSRLMVLFNGGNAEKAATLRRFEAKGVPSDRLVPVARAASRRDYLQLYHQIDIGLDPFPYNGCTTSCDALWMGVPIVTLSGNTTVSRIGKLLVENLGLRHLAASTREQYGQIAIQLGMDLQSLARQRRMLRDTMAASPLCDGRGVTRSLEQAFRDICGTEHASSQLGM